MRNRNRIPFAPIAVVQDSEGCILTAKTAVETTPWLSGNDQTARGRSTTGRTTSATISRLRCATKTLYPGGRARSQVTTTTLNVKLRYGAN